MINYIQNPKNDELYTPKYAIEPLMKYVPDNIVIWECTDYGGSHITQMFREKGNVVKTTHKRDLNFLTDKPDFDFDIIIQYDIKFVNIFLK